MPEDATGRDLLHALNLTGFAKPDAALFEPIKALATSVNMIRA